MSEEEMKALTLEDLQTMVADLTGKVDKLTSENEELKKTSEKSTADLEEARKLNQNLLNRIVSGTDLSNGKDFEPKKSLDEVAMEWFSKK